MHGNSLAHVICMPMQLLENYAVLDHIIRSPDTPCHLHLLDTVKTSPQEANKLVGVGGESFVNNSP